VFSFHPIKNITTGEGGTVCSDDAALLDRVRRLKFHGLGVDAYDRQMQGRAAQAQVLEPGYKCNLTDIAATIGLGQLESLPSFQERRAALAGRYLERLTEIDELQPLTVPSATIQHGWHLMIVRVLREAPARDRFMQALKERNIGAGLHFRAVHVQKHYVEQFADNRHDLPNTEWNSDRICSLPLFPAMTDADVDDVIDAAKDALSSA